MSEKFSSDNDFEQSAASSPENPENVEGDIEREAGLLSENLKQHAKLSESFPDSVDALPEAQRGSRYEKIQSAYELAKRRLNIAMGVIASGGMASFVAASGIYQQNPDLYRQTAQNVAGVGIEGSIVVLSALALGHGYYRMRRALQEGRYFRGDDK